VEPIDNQSGGAQRWREERWQSISLWCGYGFQIPIAVEGGGCAEVAADSSQIGYPFFTFTKGKKKKECCHCQSPSPALCRLAVALASSDRNNKKILHLFNNRREKNFYIFSTTEEEREIEILFSLYR